MLMVQAKRRIGVERTAETALTTGELARCASTKTFHCCALLGPCWSAAVMPHAIRFSPCSVILGVRFILGLLLLCHCSKDTL